METEPADSFVCKHHDNIYIPWTPHANTNAISVSHGNSRGQYLYPIRTPWEHHANSYTRWEPMGTPWEPHGNPMGNPWETQILQQNTMGKYDVPMETHGWSPTIYLRKCYQSMLTQQ